MRVTILCAVLALLVAGCGGGSVESKVAKHYHGDVRSCRAAGITQFGKIYSCQVNGTTLCVTVDGNDVFDASAEAERAGISC